MVRIHRASEKECIETNQISGAALLMDGRGMVESAHFPSSLALLYSAQGLGPGGFCISKRVMPEKRDVREACARFFGMHSSDADMGAKIVVGK